MGRTSTIIAFCVLLCLGNSSFTNNSACPPPTNDLCSGATDMGTIECEFYVEYDADSEATPDIEATGNCIDNTEPAQWYTFTTPDPLPYGTLLHFNPDVKVEVFTSTTDCSDLTYVTCGDGVFGFKPEPATTYYYLTTGGLHMQPPFSGLSTCDDPLVSYDYTQSPVVSTNYTDCGSQSADIGCENQHTLWIGYTVGCGESSDVLIEVEPYAGNPAITANEVSITVALWNCSLLLSEYDVNGLGYVCSAIGNGESILLEDVPPGLNFVIGLGSNDYNAGYFDLHITETTITGDVLNDECIDAESVNAGINTNLSNACAMPDMPIPECGPQSEATVWYQYDPEGELQNLLITLYEIGIENPAIAIYDACTGDAIEHICGTELELMCIDSPILIQVGSSLVNSGLFDMNIDVSGALPPIEPTITAEDICSGTETVIHVDIPTGEIVSIEVVVAPWSSSFVSGMTNQTFTGVSSAMVNDILVNNATTPEQVTYLINVKAPEGFCSATEIEVSFMVYPGFTTNEFELDECLPYIFEADVTQIIEGGTMPYVSTMWFWNGTELLGSDQSISTPLEESGIIIVEVIDSEGCMESAQIEIELTPTTTPTFDFPTSYCRSEQDQITFPTSSLENIAGSWSLPVLDLDVFANDGAYSTIFTANDPHCIAPVVLSIQIYSGPEPLFDLPDTICSGMMVYEFPTEDLDGLEGVWDFPIMDVSGLEGTQINTFTPTAEGCYSPYEYTFEVPASINYEFGQPDTLCRLDPPYMLENITIDSFEGFWDIPIIEPDQVIEDSIVATWTPFNNQSPCLEETSIVIYITDALVPEFQLIDSLCTLDAVYVLPTSDNNAIGGSWSLPSIDPNGLNGSVQSIFTPTDPCIESFSWEIQIIEPLTPDFTIPMSLCELDEIYELPLLSENGLQGSWSMPTIDPAANSGQQITVQFQGDPSGPCIEPVEHIIDVISAEDAVFELPELICWSDEDYILPSTSDNGVEGIWDPPFIDIQSNIGLSVSATFTPIDGSCTHNSSQSIEILTPFEIDGILTDPSGCEIDDGSIELTIIEGENLEFSIDGGVTWQTSTTFEGLGPGGYTILIHSAELTACERSIEAFLNTSDGPVLNEVVVDDVNNCVTNNGSISVDATGQDLEYSIDGGTTWQTINEFHDLEAGSYDIIIHEPSSDCTVEVNAIIADFPETQVVEVNSEDPSDCDLNDGQIEIIANGLALEYSIDNGNTWSSQNIFTNLPDGTFQIVVQSTLGEDCVDMFEVELLASEVPEIISIDVDSPTLCSPGAGVLEIVGQGNSLEYSIDGGNSWFDIGTFEDLPADIYHVVIRDKTKPNCLDEVMVELMIEEESLEESTFVVTPPSECEAADGSIEVINTLQDIEYSIDGGMTWQSSNVFSGLVSGSYVIIIRKIFFPDCLIIQPVEVPLSACPCRDLVVEFEVSNISCTTMEFASVEITSIEGMYNPDVEITWHTGQIGNSLMGIDEGWQIAHFSYDDDCNWIDSIWVEFVKPIIYDLEIHDLNCPGSNDGIIEVVNVSGGNGNYTYSIDGENFQSSNLFTDLEEGSYSVIVQDDVDCETESAIDVFSMDKVEIDLPEIDSIFIGDQIFLDPGIDENDIDSFEWTPKDGIEDPNRLIVSVAPKITTIYTLEVEYRGCVEVQEILILVKEEEEIYVGNVFSPDGNNDNDILYIKGIEDSTIELTDFAIYDRWGNKVFFISQPEFNNRDHGWDGMYHNTPVASGVFVYAINYVQRGEVKTKYGTVTVLY